MTEQHDTNEPGEDLPEEDLPARSKARRSVAGAALAASMLGVGEIIEPEKTSVDIEQVADAPDDLDDGLLNLDFGDLPPLS